MLDARIAEAKKALQLAAEISKRFYGKKLVLTYSGGKDSDVMLTLAVDVLDPDDFEVINNHTSVDAPSYEYTRAYWKFRKHKEAEAKGYEQLSLFD